MSDLRDRIADAIARVTASKAADEVIAEIRKTHVLVPRSLCERAASTKEPGVSAFRERSMIIGELAALLSPDKDHEPRR
jgi:hypothetical protein